MNSLDTVGCLFLGTLRGLRPTCLQVKQTMDFFSGFDTAAVTAGIGTCDREGVACFSPVKRDLQSWDICPTFQQCYQEIDFLNPICDVCSCLYVVLCVE